VDYEVWLIKASDLVAADSNGKSDPYPVVYQGGTASKLTLKFARKFDVKAKNLNPVWDMMSLEIAAPKPGETFTIDLYDKDVLSDDFLGHVKVDVLAHVGKGPVTLPLEPRAGKKDKVKGNVTFELREQGAHRARELGPSLSRHYAKWLTGNDKWESISAVHKMWLIFKTLCAGKESMPSTKVADFLKEMSGQSGHTAEESAAVMRIYDDNKDGSTDFFELMNFFHDSVQKMTSEQGKARFVITGAFSTLVKDDGKVDIELLKKILTAFVPMPGKRDQEKLKEAVETAAKEVMEGLDANKDGTVSMKELREYCLESPALQSVIRTLQEVPMKKD